jgi:O-antigen/teichoic acid export membrane protein
MYITAEEIISILFTQKWAVSVKYFELMVFSTYALPISVVLLNILSGNGHSGKFLKLELWKKLIGLTAMIVGFWGGIERFLEFNAVATLMALLLNMWYVSKIIPLSIRHQLSTIWKYAIIAFLGSLLILNIIPNSDMAWLTLSLKTILYIIIYIGSNIGIKTNGWVSFHSLFINKILNKLKRQAINNL